MKQGSNSIYFGDTFRMHLQGECIRDDECLLPAKLMSPDHKKWGHWNCLIKEIKVKVSAAVDDIAKQEGLTRVQKSKMKEDLYQAELQRIQINWRDVFRDILKLYRLRDHLFNARKIAPSYGEAWLYGDQVGLAMVVALMNNADIFIYKIKDSLSQAWERNKIIYDDLRKKSTITSSHLAYTALRDVEGKFRDFAESYRMAADQIEGIKAASANHTHTRAIAEECKNQLLRGLVADLIYHGKENEPEYHILEQELLKLNATLNGAPELLPLGRNTHVALTEEARPELIVITRAEAADELLLAVTIPAYPMLIVHANHDELPIPNTTTAQLLGDPMPALPPTTEQFVYASDKLKIAYEVQQIFISPLRDSSARHLKAPVLQDFCDDFHRKIYQNVLAPFQARAENRFVSLCCFYNTEEWELLKRHQSRFNHALYVITEKLLPLKRGHDRDNYELQLSVINTCLLGNLFLMCQEITWHKAAVKLYFTDNAFSHPTAVEALPLNELENGSLEIVSDAARAILANNRADRAETETRVANAAASAANAAASAANAAASAANAAASAALAAIGVANAAVEAARADAERSAISAQSSNAILQEAMQMLPRNRRRQLVAEHGAGSLTDLELQSTASLRF